MCDSDIFISIPCLAVLKSIDEDLGVCRRFLPTMYHEGEETCKKYVELKSEYAKLKARVCGGTDFIIRTTNGSSHGQR